MKNISKFKDFKINESVDDYSVDDIDDVKELHDDASYVRSCLFGLGKFLKQLESYYPHRQDILNHIKNIKKDDTELSDIINDIMGDYLSISTELEEQLETDIETGYRDEYGDMNESYDTYDIFPEYQDRREMLMIMFTKAIETGNAKSVEHLIKTFNVNPSFNNEEALQQACIGGNMAMLKVLMADRRVDVTVGKTELAIQHTIDDKHWDMAEVLLNHKRTNPGLNMMQYHLVHKTKDDVLTDQLKNIFKLLTEKPKFKEDISKPFQEHFDNIVQVHGYAENFQEYDIYEKQHILEEALTYIINELKEIKSKI